MLILAGILCSLACYVALQPGAGAARLKRVCDASALAVKPQPFTDSLRKLLHPSHTPEVALTTVMELVAAALGAGLPVPKALERVAASLGESGAHLRAVALALQVGSSWEAAWAYAPRSYTPMAALLALGESTGAQVRTLLLHGAKDHRRQQRSTAQVKAAQLSVSLLLPTAVCVLPAFLCLGVIPVVIGFIRELGIIA